MAEKTIEYHARGSIERVVPGRGYMWKSGYSAAGEGGSVLYPWMTAAECRKDAEAQGARAVFIRGDLVNSGTCRSSNGS